MNPRWRFTIYEVLTPMSRIGRKPIPVPSDVTVELKDGVVQVKGPKGDLSFKRPPEIIVEHDKDAKELRVSRKSDARHERALHGMTRAMINNMVVGVREPFVKKLEIQGVGYNAALVGQSLRLQVGFANAILVPIPKGVTCQVVDPTHVTVSSPDRHAVGQFAADVRKVRPPEPYKGKGVRYEGEQVRRKAGKSAAGGK